MKEKMRAALASLPTMIRLNFPDQMKLALLEYGVEIDRLRAEVDELRSKIEKE